MPAGVAGHIDIDEAKETSRLLLTVPQRTVPILKATPGVGKSDVIEQLAFEMVAKYPRQGGCKGCQAVEGGSTNPLDHEKGCPAYHNPEHCNICAKDRVVIRDVTDKDGKVIDRKACFEAQPPHIKLIDIRLSTFDPVETKGLPYVADGDMQVVVNGEKTVLTRWACPEWLPTDNDIYCILFLDEYLNAPAAVQNASLQLVYDRKLHTHKLGRLVAMACAGNTEGDGSYITRMGGAAKNRFAHLEVEASPKPWLAWAKANDILPEFIGAVEAHPDTFIPTTFNRDLDAQSTPRSFTTVARLVDQHKIRTDRDLRRIASPLIGTGATVELVAYISQYQRIKPADIIQKGIFPTFEKDQASHKYAASCAVANWIHRNSAEVKTAEHVANLFTFLQKLGAELSIKTLKDMHLNEHSGMVVLVLKHGAPEFRNMMQELSQAVTAAENEPVKARKK